MARASSARKAYTTGTAVVGSSHTALMVTVGVGLFGVLLVSVIVTLNVPPAVGAKVTVRFEAVPGDTVSGFGAAEK